jgi:hypothetical protein
MKDTCAIDLRVRLPRPLADEVERVKERHPEMLSQIVAYGMTRRAVYEHLVALGFGERREVGRNP